MSRLSSTFEALKAEGRSAFVTFITAGDPNLKSSQAILDGLPEAGADIIELGMPFTDPSADGPVIDKAAQRALANGASLKSTLEMVTAFRKKDKSTPIVLMGYFNPVYIYGTDTFAEDAAHAGVDGLIIVDLPPEEDEELKGPANSHGIDLIRLATPTSDDARLPTIVSGASGFIYYVAVAGVTGGKSATTSDIKEAVSRIRRHTDLPVAVGFGIKTFSQAREMATVADGAVVGSAIVSIIENGLDAIGKPEVGLTGKVLDFVRELASGVSAAQK